MSTPQYLPNRTPDYIVASLKGTLGAIPVVGAVLAEVIGTVIPNQRLDRLADFAQKLSDRVEAEHRELVQQRILEPEGTDILEEALWQSARALSEERRERIASVVKNGLTEKEVDLFETKKLLQILSQIDDLELILLRVLAANPNQDLEFRAKFAASVRPVPALIGASPDVLDAHAMSESMRTHLTQLGLIRPFYPIVKIGALPEFDSFRGEFRHSGHEVTLLGRLLLRATDFDPKK